MRSYDPDRYTSLNRLSPIEEERDANREFGSDYSDLKKEDLIALALFLGSFCLGGLAVPAVVASFVFLFSKAQPTTWNAVLFTASCIAVALGLYTVRRLKRLHYGALEIGFGAASCFHTFFKIGQSELFSIERWVPVIGALYLLVRGFVNIQEGIEIRKKKRLNKPIEQGGMAEKGTPLL